MEKLKVIFRKDKENNVIGFFPELPANIGKIVCYEHIGQHGEADIGFFHSLKKASPAEYAELLSEMQSIYGQDNGELDPPIQLVVRQRITYADRESAYDWI